MSIDKNKEENLDLENLTAADEELYDGETNEEAAESEALAVKDKKPKKDKTPKMKSQFALRRGSFTIAITAIVIAAVVLFNILITVIADSFPVQLDLTTDNSYSLSSDNIDFIKSVNKDIKIVVACTEDQYTSDSGLPYYAQYSYYYAQDTSGGEDGNGYYQQTKQLLNKYNKYNSHITVEFADPSEPSFAKKMGDYADSFKLGDIIVSCKSGDNTRYDLVDYYDVYELTNKSSYTDSYAGSYFYYDVTANNIESAIASAIYTVTADSTTRLGLYTNYNTTGYLETYQKTLEQNNYEIVQLDGIIDGEIDNTLDGLIFCAPANDISAAEEDYLNKFMKNDGNEGKSIIFLPSVNGTVPTNFAEFLAEWGINYSDGYVYETESGNYVSGDPTYVGMINQCTKFTESVNTASTLYIAQRAIPMSPAFQEYGDRSVSELMKSSTNCVVMPSDADANWTPAANAKKADCDTVMMGIETTTDDMNVENSSHVLAFSTSSFIYNDYTDYDTCGNIDFALAATNAACGRASNTKLFVSKSVADETFTATSSQSSVVLVIFMIMFPLVILAWGIAIRIRRKRR